MIYICGDSFGVSDAKYGTGWMDIFSNKFPVTNLSQVCASNLMIAQQVETAITESANFVIVLFTSSTRNQTKINNKLIPYSIHSLDHTTPFTTRQLAIIKEYTTEFFDLELAIYQNQLVVEATLQKLADSGIRFIFDQGGFEHPSYGGTKKYFTKFDSYRSKLNLWDYAQTRKYRPYHHIDNSIDHSTIANYYMSIVKNEQI
jgi:hypothetical protein